MSLECLRLTSKVRPLYWVLQIKLRVFFQRPFQPPGQRLDFFVLRNQLIFCKVFSTNKFLESPKKSLAYLLNKIDMWKLISLLGAFDTYFFQWAWRSFESCILQWNCWWQQLSTVFIEARGEKIAVVMHLIHREVEEKAWWKEKFSFGENMIVPFIW